MLLSRRQVCKRAYSAVLTLQYMPTLSWCMAALAINEAMASEASVSSRRYLNIQRFQAPPRWNYDLFLKPFGEDMRPSGAVGTVYRERRGRYVGIDYETTLSHGLQVPYLWSINVPAPSGEFRPMSDLLPHMLQIRGMNSLNPEHEQATKNGFFPPGSVIGLGGLGSDYSTKSIAGVVVDPKSYLHGSINGNLPVILNSRKDPFKDLLDPYKYSQSEDSIEWRDRLKENFQKIDQVIEASLKSRGQGFDVISRAKRSAKDLMMSNLNELESRWLYLLQKYESLVSRSLTLLIPRINDIPIGKVGERGNEYNLDLQASPANSPDLRDMIAPQTYIEGLAANFALAELILVNNLSNSVTIQPGFLRDIQINRSSIGFAHPDEHNTGRMPSLFLNAHYDAAFSSCLLELISSLKSAGIFSSTVIQVGSEFNRLPRWDGSGSDHAFLATSVVYYSGMISGPFVMGNIALGDKEGNYQGTCGEGATNEAIDNKILDVCYLPPTLSTLLGVPFASSIRSLPSLVKVVEDKVVPLLPNGTTLDQKVSRNI